MAKGLTLQLKGYKEVKKNLGPELFATTFGPFADEGGPILLGALKSGAPKGPTGDTEAGLVMRQTAGKYPSVRVLETAKHYGYPYPTLTEFSAKYHHKGWAVAAALTVKERLEALLIKLIEKAWVS